MNQNESLVKYASRQLGIINNYPSHLKKVAACLEEIESGTIKRLIVQLPPRSGKTCLASEAFPLWYLERNPDKTVFSVFYSHPLAFHFSQKFNTENHYKAIGVGTPIAGVGADLIVIDDPTINLDDSDSDHYQRRLRDWYTGILRTRLTDDGAIVVFQSCFSYHDLSNWLLRTYSDENWTVLKISAINEKNESYWPEKFSIDRLLEIKKMIRPSEWKSLYEHRF